MRNVILMIILFGYQASAGVFSQSKVNLELKNASFKELVDVIVEQTDLGFWYDTAQLRELNKINIDVENLSVEEVLDQVFENTAFAYEVEHKTILIRKLPQAVEVDAQEKKSVKGKVVDDQGIPLPGVSVVVKGTSVGVATDIDGNYSLESEQEKVVLVFSFVGMVSQEIVYNGQAEINVTLGLDTEQMEEVVITGYQTLKKGRATGSFNIVKSEELNTIVSTSLTDKLYGVSPGLLVNNGEITIRGISSLQAGNTPLIVLDGFPFRGELDDINPEDIEQMTVLKDAASTAIYGIEGANGVIVISTKSAEKNNKVKINYSSLVRCTEKPKYKDLGYASSSDHIDMMFNYFDQNGFQNFGGTDELSYTWFRNNVENSLSDAEANKIYDFYRKSDDLNKHMFDRNFVERHNLSMSYGTEVNQLYTSVAIEKQKIRKGINNEVNLFSFSLNDHLNINKYVDVDFILRANQNKKNIGSYDVNYLMPYTRLYDQAGNFYNTNSRYYGGADLALLESQGAKSHFKNELQEDQLIDNKKRTRQLNSIFKINVKPIDGVVWSSSFGYDYTDIKHLTFYDKESYYARNLYNSNLSNDLSYNLIPYGNIQDEVYADRKVKTLRTQLSLNKTLGDFSLSGIAGFERNEFKESGSGNIRRYNYDPQALSESFINVPQTSTFTNIYGKNVTYLPSNYAPQRKETIQRFQSVYFTGSVSYKGKYSLFGSWRSDETNLFGQSAEYRQQPSWSVGTKWNVKEEFLKEIDQINHLSLKGSYGLSGRVDHTTSPYMIISNRYDSYTGKQATYVSNPPNPSLSWEKAYTTNIGLDFGLFNKINGTIEF
jgi:TonB-linked SusC/RagA family outer membrane protein